jgi:hypothetical protein
MKTVGSGRAPAAATIAVVVACAVLVGTAVPAGAALPGRAGSGTVDQLLALIQTKLQAENSVLTSGSTANLDAIRPQLRETAALTVTDRAEALLRRRTLLAEHGLRYSNISSELTLLSGSIAGDAATTRIREDTTITISDVYSGGPPFTKESGLAVGFARSRGAWAIVGDETLTEPSESTVR